MVNSAIFITVFACIIAIIVVAINRKMSNIEIALAENTETMQKQEEQSMPKALTEIVAREPNTNNFTYVTSEDGIQVPVPKGYVASTDVEERYVNGVTTDGVREHHGGFVIYEKNAGETDEQATAAIENDIDEAQRERNQWVWIPINDVKDMYHTSGELIYANEYTFSSVDTPYAKSITSSTEPRTYNVTNTNLMYDYDHKHLKGYMAGISRNEFQQEMREDFAEMLKSVATYGGFYVGRYETGNLSKNNAKVVKGQTGTTSSSNTSDNNINNINWYKSYLKCRGLRGKNPIHTDLIWGIQWDETLVWLMKTGEKTPEEVISNSRSWGNYSYGTASVHGIQATGNSEICKANNVYDLAGNIWEWTMESNSYSRNLRGGSFAGFNADYGDTVRYRYTLYNPDTESILSGCRASFYIM